MMRPWSWDEYFINEAYLAARKSKDPSTMVGAVIVGPDHEIRSKGYNGPPRGFNDDDPAIMQRPLKYALVIHAEMNAILAAARAGIICKGCTLYCTFHPCSGCAGAIVQAGITEVTYHAENPGSEQWSWKEDQSIAQRIFNECGVQLSAWSGVPVIPEIMSGGKLHRFI